MKLYYTWSNSSYCWGCESWSMKMKDLFFETLEKAKEYSEKRNSYYVIYELDVESRETKLVYRSLRKEDAV